MTQILSSTPESIRTTLFNLCRIKSVTDSQGEREAPRFLYECLRRLPYFQNHPSYLFLQLIEGDRLGRENLCAWVRAEQTTKKTVILMGHFDVVDTDVCGSLRDEAFDPQLYTRLIRGEKITEEAKDDLESGEWVFGRGTADMKSGLVVQAAVLADFAEHAETLNVNLLYVAVADEENNASGIHQAVRYLSRLKHDEDWEFLCCIDSEPSITQERKDHGWVHTGTIGMYTPFTFIIGREAHAGEYFEGLPASLIAFQMGTMLEGSERFSDAYEGVTYPPLTCLKFHDLKASYSVTVIERVAMYFNCLFITKTPDEVLGLLKEAAFDALQVALDRYRRNWSGQKSHSKMPDWAPRVMEYGELLMLAEERAKRPASELCAEFLSSTPAAAELQERGLRLVNYLVDIAGLKGPTVVVGFLPPYCPSHFNHGQTDKERKVLEGVGRVVELAHLKFQETVSVGEIYEGISDLSEFGFNGTNRDIECLSKNLPGWGIDFEYPFDQSKYLDVPVVNIGPIGKDAHKNTERLHLHYATRVLPSLLKEMIRSF